MRSISQDLSIKNILKQFEQKPGIEASYKWGNLIKKPFLTLKAPYNSEHAIVQIKSVLSAYIDLDSPLAHTKRYISFATKLKDALGYDELIKTVTVVLKGFDLTDVRRVLFNDDSPIYYKLAVKTAEYHTYLKFTDHLGNSESIGWNGKGNLYGLSKAFNNGYIRNDTHYDLNYGNDQSFETANAMLDRGQYASSPNKAVSFVEFVLPPLRFIKVKNYINSEIQFPSKLFYSIAGMAGIENCNRFAQRIFEKAGFKGHYYDLIRPEETDANDMGILYNMFTNIEHNGDLIHTNYIAGLARFAGNIIGGPNIESAINWGISLVNTLDGVRIVETRPLTTVETYLLFSSLNLLEKNALYYAASIPIGPYKQPLLEEILLYNDINLHETDAYNLKTALSICVAINDVDCMRLIINQDPSTIKFTNHNQHKLVSIACINKAYKALAALIRFDPASAYYDANGEFDYPICILAKAGYYIDPALGFNEGICKNDDQIENVLTIFGESLHQPTITFDGII